MASAPQAQMLRRESVKKRVKRPRGVRRKVLLLLERGAAGLGEGVKDMVVASGSWSVLGDWDVMVRL